MKYEKSHDKKYSYTWPRVGQCHDSDLTYRHTVLTSNIVVTVQLKRLNDPNCPTLTTQPKPSFRNNRGALHFPVSIEDSPIIKPLWIKVKIGSSVSRENLRDHILTERKVKKWWWTERSEFLNYLYFSEPFLNVKMNFPAGFIRYFIINYLIYYNYNNFILIYFFNYHYNLK